MTFPYYLFGAGSQNWGAISQGAVLILPQTRLNLKLSSQASFFFSLQDQCNHYHSWVPGSKPFPQRVCVRTKSLWLFVSLPLYQLYQLRPAHLAWAAKRSYPTSKVGAAAKSARLRRHRNSGEELPHIWGQGQRLGGATPPPRSGGCAGAGGPRGAIPLSRSGGAAVRRYPSSKVRRSGCALLEQPWRDTPHPR